MRKAFLFSLLFGLGLGAWAQHTSNGGKFEVDEIRGCAPFTFKITNINLDGSSACPCTMIFDGASNCPAPLGCSNTFTFTSNTQGKYKLQVIYQGSNIDYIDITVDPNIKPEFEIYSCAGSKVQINVTDRNYDFYNIDFNGDNVIDQTISSGITQKAMFNYGAGSAGQQFNIKVQGQKTNGDNNCDITSKPFDVISALPIPSITSLTAKSIDTLILKFTPVANINYKSDIAINSGPPIGLPVPYGASSLTIPNVKVNDNYYCVRLNSFDPCANQNKYSPFSICSHKKFSATPASGENQLTWTTSSQNISTIDIKRDGAIIGSVAGSATSYTDKTAECKKTYQYQLVSNYPNGAISTSLLSKPITAFLTQTPISIINTSAVVNEPEADLVWIQDPLYTAASYDILRKPKGGTFNKIGSSTSTDFSDKFYNNAGYCYQINYTDNCDNKSDPGLRVCPMLLTNTLDDYNNVTLDWSAYKGWALNVKNYQLLYGYQPGQASQLIYSGPDSTSLDTKSDPKKQVIYYKVIATANEPGVTQSVSNEIKVVRNINLFYPTAFNPESSYVDPITKEKVDRIFTVKGHFITTMKLQIFDRWGSLVFYSEENEPWDGKREGMPMPDGTYVWTADGTDQAGNSFKKAGTVVLIRK